MNKEKIWNEIIKNNMVVHCKTEQELLELLELLGKKYLKWGTGLLVYNHSHFEKYKDNICYSFSDKEMSDYGYIHWYRERNYIILEAESLINQLKENTKSKEYTLSEVIKEYEDGYTGEFKFLNKDIVIHKSIDNYIVTRDEGRVIMLAKNTFESKYIKLPEYIDREEALKAIENGKTVCNEYDGTTVEYNLSNSISIDRLIKGKWFVREDNKNVNK